MKKLIWANFHLSVWVAILGCIAVINLPGLVLEDADGLYGPLRNNLLIVLGYLLIGEVGLWYWRYLRGSRIEALMMGSTFLLVACGYQFYGSINGLPVTWNISLVTGYVGLSHLAYYFADRLGGSERAPTAQISKRDQS